MLVKNMDDFMKIFDGHEDKLQSFQLPRFVEALKKYNPDILHVLLLPKEVAGDPRFSIHATVREIQDGIEKYNDILAWWHPTADQEIIMEINDWDEDYLPISAMKDSIVLWQDTEFAQQYAEKQEGYAKAVDRLVELYEQVCGRELDYASKREAFKELNEVWCNSLDNNNRVKAYARIDKEKYHDFLYYRGYHSRDRVPDLYYPVKIGDKWYGYDLCFKTFYGRNGKKDEICLVFRGIDELKIQSVKTREFALMQRPILDYLGELTKITGTGFGIISSVCMPLMSEPSTCVTLDTEGVIDNLHEKVYNIFKEILIMQEIY